ncbi:MAG: aminopeptidase P family protein [Chloroflexi bacterium]|nr:aminopeptidase P family protein [Chloroflexota bacterium]
MYTMRSTLKRGREVWDRINMPATEFQKRVEIIREEMNKKDVDILLLYGTSPDHYANPTYVSNCMIKMPAGLLVAIPQNDEMVYFFEGGSREIPAVKTTIWFEQARPAADMSVECVKYLKEKNLIPSTIGVVGFRELMPYYQSRFLFESLSQCKIVDFGPFLRDMKAIKSERERDQMRRSARILNLAFGHIINNPPRQTNERAIEAILDKTMRLEGAEDCRVLIARPQEEKWAFRPAEDMPVLPSSTIIIYLAVEFERYWSECIRTFVAESGRLVPPDLQNVQASYERVLHAIKAGKTVSQFYRDTMADIQKSDVDCIPTYGLGQGIGLSLQEHPVLAESETIQLKEGMCFTLRLAMRDHGKGAIMIGNTVILSANGLEVLTG